MPFCACLQPNRGGQAERGQAQPRRQHCAKTTTANASSSSAATATVEQQPIQSGESDPREQEDTAYGEISDGDSPGTSKRNTRGGGLFGFLKRKNRGRRVDGAERRRPSAANAELRKLPTQPIPPIPASNVPRKKVSFSWTTAGRSRHQQNQSNKDSYDYIDAEEGGPKGDSGGGGGNEDSADGGGGGPLPAPEEGASSSHANNHRYDYPTFLAASRRERMMRRQQQQDEPFYASASQTYSLGSEDPYSSIVSVGDRPLAGDESSETYEPGYSRIRDGPAANRPNIGNSQNQSLTRRAEPRTELDALYAKINRRPSYTLASTNFPHPKPSGSSSSASLLLNNGCANKQKQQKGEGEQPPNRQIGTIQQQPEEEESGSGSVTSGSQPSYRYLTVRESVDVVRERIRRREEQQQAIRAENAVGANGTGGSSSTGPRGAEHYYSTINEYESVGSDSNYGGSLPRGGPGLADQRHLAVSLSSSSSTANGQPPTTSSAAFYTPLYIDSGGEGNGGRQAGATMFSQSANSIDTLRIMLSPKGNGEPPRPPTSPIPKPCPQLPGQPPQPPPPLIRRPIILPPRGNLLKMASGSNSPAANGTAKPANRMSIPPAANSSNNKKANQGNSTNGNGTFQSHVRSMLHPLLHNGSLQMILAGAGGSKKTTAGTNGHSSLENGHFQGQRMQMESPQQINGNKKLAEAETQTYCQQTSRIPVPVCGGGRVGGGGGSLRTRTPSPTQDTGTQTTGMGLGSRGESGQQNQGQVQAKKAAIATTTNKQPKASAPPLPALVGRDYVSPVDMGQERGWPLAMGTGASGVNCSMEEDGNRNGTSS